MNTRKIASVITFLIVIQYSTLCQNAFYDAKKLSGMLDSKNCFNLKDDKTEKMFKSIMKNYQIDSTEFKENPFLISYWCNPKWPSANIGATEFVGLYDQITSSVGGLNITTIADGMAKFIVKRTKQELNIAFFEKFKEELEDPEFVDLRTVFPQTYKTLMVVGDDIYMYEAYIQTLREAFKRDIATLPVNLPEIMKNHVDYFNEHKELKAELQTGFYIAQAIQNKQHPGTIIEDYPIEYLDSIQNLNIKAAFQVMKLFSTSLKSNTDSIYWVSLDDAKKHFNDDVFLNIYLGLIYQLAKQQNITFDNKSFAGMLSNTYPESKSYKPYILNVITKAQTIETKIKGLKKIGSDSLLFENYYNVVSTSIDLMKYAVRIDTLPILKGYHLKLEEETKPYFNLAQTAADLAIDVNRKNYALAIINGVQIFNTVFDTSKITDKNEKEKYAKISSKLLKYGSFVALVAQASSSDEVEAAIEAIALPTGSSRIKRESAVNISVNAYCGLFIGQNRNYFWSKPDYSYGITAPIGIAASWGHRCFFGNNCKARASSSVFISIVDLGAITAFRFINDSATVSKIQLKDIISPGIFYSYGIPKCPISLNLGCQLAPLLTSVGSTNSYAEKRAFRFTFGICVDLPILNLYNKSK
jgi:hypothetical protein